MHKADETHARLSRHSRHSKHSKPRSRFRAAVIAIHAIIAVFAIVLTGSAGGTYALWNASATVDAGTIHSGTISAAMVLHPGFDTTFAPGNLTRTGSITITNNGNVLAPYTTDVAMLASSTQPFMAAIDDNGGVLIWPAATPRQCTPEAVPLPGDLSLTMLPTGTLAAGESDTYCMRISLNPAVSTILTPYDGLHISLSATLRIGGWTSTAVTQPVKQSYFNSSAIHRIVNSKSGKCLSDSGVGDGLQQSTCSRLTVANQSWNFNQAPTLEYFTIAPDTRPSVVWDVYGMSRAENAPVVLYAAHPLVDGQMHQQWRVVGLGSGNYQFIAGHSQKCLSVAGGSMIDGGTLEQVTCNPRDAAQVFRLDPIDVAPPSAPTGLTASGVTDTAATISWTATDNVGVVGYDIYAGAVQVASTVAPTYSYTGLPAASTFTYTVRARDAAGNVSAASSVGSVSTQPSVTAWYGIINPTSGKCVDVAASGTANGSTIWQLGCIAGQTSQAWQFQAATAGNYSVLPQHATTMRMDVAGGPVGGQLDHNAIQLWTSTSATNQQWKVVPLGGGNYSLIASHSGKCLAVVGGSTLDQALFEQMACDRSAAQLFRLRAVG